MADGTATSGAARKARERRARANARHIQWLASSWQLLAAHHTQPFSAAGRRQATVDEVTARRLELETVRGELAAIRSLVQKASAVREAVDPDHKAQEDAARKAGKDPLKEAAEAEAAEAKRDHKSQEESAREAEKDRLRKEAAKVEATKKTEAECVAREAADLAREADHKAREDAAS